MSDPLVYRPISSILPLEALPHQLFHFGGGDLLDGIALVDSEMLPTDAGVAITVLGRIVDPVRIELPLIDSVAILLGGHGTAESELIGAEVEIEAADGGSVAVRARISSQALGIAFDPGVLQPVKMELDGNRMKAVPVEGEIVVPIPVALEVAYDDDWSFDLAFSEEGPLQIDLPLCRIGNTGLILEIENLTFNFSGSGKKPQGASDQWKGILIEKGRLYIPEIFDGHIEVADFGIGTGGLWGKADIVGNTPLSYVGGAFTGGLKAGEVFGVKGGISRVAVELVQTIPAAVTVEGKLMLPFFDETPIAFEAGFGIDGDIHLKITGAGPDGRVHLQKSGVLDFGIESLSFERKDGVITVKLAGNIKPLVGADKGLIWPSFDIDELSIDSNGHLSLTGGWIDLPQGYTLDLFAFKLEITKFGAGKDENGNQYIGFNGGLDLVKGIPAGASVEGLRITWGPNLWPPLISVKGVGCELTIPDKLHFKGEVSYEELGDLKAFTGAILLELPAVNGLTVDGKIVFGSTKDPTTQKRFKYFAIYLEGEFGTGIPLWASGLALNGIAGLFSVNYGPDKPGDWMWYSMDKSKSWFHKPPIGVTDIIKKWAPQRETWAIGAGASIATYADGGHLFNGKFLLLLVFPGPVFMIDGRGNFLEKPTADKEPLFHALVVLDVKAGYFLIGLDAQWKYNKEDGKLVQIAGSAETFFNFKDPSDWHIYIGKDTPMEQRIRASFAGGLQANAYFMLDPRALRLGVWIGKNEHYRFGPVGADLEAWLDANATLSFRPPHLNASVWLHGLLGVKVFKWKFAIGLDARLEADVAKPFHILGSVAIRIETRLKDFEFEVRIEYGPRAVRPQIPPIDAATFTKSGVAHLKSTNDWPLLADGGGTDRGVVVPLDARPYFMFEQPVHDATGISINPSPDPGWITIGDRTTGKGAARVRYELKPILLESSKPGGPWKPYPHKLYGAWGAAPPNPGNGGTQNRFMVYAKTPFDLTDDTDGWNPWAATNLPNYPCPVVANETICIDWQRWQTGTELQPPFSDSPSGVGVTWSGGTRTVVGIPSLTFRGIAVGSAQKGIRFPSNTRLDTVAYVSYEQNGKVSVINTFTDALIDSAVGAPIGVGATPIKVAFSPDGRLAFVSNGGSNTISIIDTATNKVLGVPITVEAAPRMIAFSGDGSKAWVASATTGIVSVIDVASRTVTRIKLDDVAWGIALSPDGSRLYVMHPTAGRISVLDPATGNRIGDPIQVPGGASNIVFAPNGFKAYVPAASLDVLRILDTKTNTLLPTTVPLKEFPRELTITPDGSTLYIANGGAEPSVSIVDTASQTVVTTIPVVGTPFGIAMHPSGAKVYVALYNARAVSVIDTATRKVTKTITIGAWTQGIAVCPVPTIRTEVEPTEVFIDVPRGTAQVEVLLYQASGRITGEVLDPHSKLPPAVGADGQSPGRITLRFDAKEFGFAEGIRRIRIRSDQEWILLRVCITRPALAGGLEDLNKLHDELADGLSVWGEPGAVLEPNTDYRLTVQVEKRVVGIGELAGWNESEVLKHSRRFRTDGPPGIGKPLPPAHADNLPDKSGLEDLQRYVSQTIPATVAPEGARPELQKPVYRGYDVGVAFNEDYVDRMYELASRDLAIRFHDANDNPVRNIDGGLIVFANKWGNAATVTLTETRRQWIEMLNAATCLPKDIDVTTLPKNKKLATSDHVLEPDTLYEARLVPLLFHAPIPGGEGWDPEAFAPGVTMIKRTADGAGQWTDVLIQVLVRPMPAGVTGVAFRVGANVRYVFAIDVAQGKRSLTGAAGPKRESAFAYDATKQYQISIEAIGSRLRIEQDGELVFDVASDTSSPAGSVGLFPWLASGPQRFAMLSVHDFRKSAPVAYRFPFTTSRYVDFHHQVQSHSGETWPGVLPSTFAATTIVTATAATLQTPPPEPEARAYDQFAEAVLRSAARQLPKRIEATRVDDPSNTPFALLVRGDEPIDWRRATLKVERAAAAAPVLVPAATMKITDATFGGTQPVDVVSVLLAEPLDPTGYRIELQVPPRPVRETAAAPLLADKFAQNDLAGWTLTDEIPNMATSATSSWSTANGELRLRNNVTTGTAPSFLGTFAAAGDGAWGDVVLRARVRCPGGGAIGVVVRGGGVDDYYRFSMDNRAGYRQLVAKAGGTYTVLWRDSVAYDPARSYDLAIVAAGDTLRGYLDGVPLFAVSDAARATGIVALYVWNAEAFFSNVRVDTIAAATDAWLLDERFAGGVSSRWTFDSPAAWQAVNGDLLAPDLMTTGAALAGDVAWTDSRISARMVLGPTGTTALAFRHQSNARNYQLRWEPAGGRLKLVRVLAGVETVLWQSAWSPSTATETLLTIDCLGASITGYVNGVRLFQAKDESIPAGRTGFIVSNKTGTKVRELRVAAGAWTSWYTFGQERKRDAGTRIEVRVSAPATLPAAEPGTVRKFNAGVPRLPNEDVVLRLVDAGGAVLHARRFLPPATFAAVPVRLMRSADGTGFVVLAQQGALAAGTYRLSLKYERVKIGVEPDLSRGGASTPEVATIDVTI